MTERRMTSEEVELADAYLCQRWLSFLTLGLIPKPEKLPFLTLGRVPEPEPELEA